MIFLLYISWLIVFAYCLFGLKLLTVRFSSNNRSQLSSEKKMIVIVPVRNEEKGIIRLLESILRNNYSNYEVYIVNDNSNDSTVRIVTDFCEQNSHFFIEGLLQVGSSPKKSAITQIVNKTTSDVIVTTDGDCEVPTDWLRKINNAYSNQSTKIVFGSVRYYVSDLFTKLLQAEFGALMQVSLRMAKLNMSFTCNGANLSYSREAFVSVNGFAGIDDISSGDDELLMKKILKKYPKSYEILNDNWVYTEPVSSLKELYNQRVRWASKWKYAKLIEKLPGLCILMVYLSVLNMFILSPNTVVFGVSIVLLLLKFMIDIGLESKSNKVYPLATLLVFLFYPIYALIIGFSSLIVRAKWKGRLIQ